MQEQIVAMLQGYQGENSLATKGRFLQKQNDFIHMVPQSSQMLSCCLCVEISWGIP